MNLKLKRDPRNPLILPEPSHLWESRYVFNCAIANEDNLFHMIYRAMGVDDVSRLGYAASLDGVHFSRLDKPVFSPKNSFETKGCEDPRLTKVNGEYYMLYTAYSRIGTRVSMASTKNFITWKRYGVILPDQNDKDAALFPEKVNGKYMIYHRIEPDIWVSFSDDLLHWSEDRVIMKPRKNSWDSLKVGIGAPPIKTSHGWLMLYHGVDDKFVYRLGFALFDLNDPTKLLKRSDEPILEPEEDFELFGQVSNVVFSDAMIVHDDEYMIYYGGADNCIALATVPVNEVEKEF
ncbi:MAG: glycosidase [Thermotogae bacterium]|jgi:predicted GH43/DUF377 family glycosyl hydrolase|nr:glycosidase [Thermotogota bacterium]